MSPTGEAVLAEKGGSDVMLKRLRPAARNLMLAALGERWDKFWHEYGRSKKARLVKAMATFPGQLAKDWGVLLKMDDANLMWVRVPGGWPDGEGMAWGCSRAGMGDGYFDKKGGNDEEE